MNQDNVKIAQWDGMILMSLAVMITLKVIIVKPLVKTIIIWAKMPIKHAVHVEEEVPKLAL